MDFEKFYIDNLKLTKKRIRESVTKDQLVIQAINNINEIDKVSNILVKRLREWYELYLPEFSKKTYDHEEFVNLILKFNKEELLKKINLKNSESMGVDLNEEDLKPILNLAKQVSNLYELRKLQESYLENLMKETCQNLLKIAGATTGAKLISLAGSLKHLAELPSSTIQVLGAEKALFRHLRTGNRPPKYGILHEHPLVQKAKQKEKGKAARKLAAKISIAARVDYFGKKQV